jgi:hypothetical protein
VDAVSWERVFDAKQRQSLADVLHDDMRRERGRCERTRQHLVRQCGRDDIGIAGRVYGLIANARNDHSTLATALVRELARLVETVSYHLALRDQLLQVRVTQLDALFLERQIAQVAAPTAAVVLALAALLPVSCFDVGVGVVLGATISHTERCGHRLDSAQLFSELDLELLGVDAFSLRDEQPPFEQLQLLPQSLVSRAQTVALQLQAGDALGKGRAFRLQRREQLWKRSQLCVELDALHVA